MARHLAYYSAKCTSLYIRKRKEKTSIPCFAYSLVIHGIAKHFNRRTIPQKLKPVEPRHKKPHQVRLLSCMPNDNSSFSATMYLRFMSRAALFENHSIHLRGIQCCQRFECITRRDMYAQMLNCAIRMNYCV